jgi:hypothetical protein
VPYRLFLLNNILAGVMMYYFYWLLMKKYKEMSYPMEKEDNREFEGKLIVMTLSFTLVVIISLFSTEKSIWGLLPFGLYNFWNRVSNKKKITKHA